MELDYEERCDSPTGPTFTETYLIHSRKECTTYITTNNIVNNTELMRSNFERKAYQDYMRMSWLVGENMISCQKLEQTTKGIHLPLHLSVKQFVNNLESKTILSHIKPETKAESEFLHTLQGLFIS
jgi:hypothetical protein